MNDLTASELAEICRAAVDEELYGGHAPTSSNALTEVWPTRKGAAFLVADEEWAVVVARKSDLDPDLFRADWSEGK